MKTERLQLRVSKEVKEYLEIISRMECRSVSAQIEFWTLRQKAEDLRKTTIETGELEE